ncbi:unnamed protein product [Arabis nemorensis]|uniref:Uncharacterized protein n=1 Tax=Arabis nemorensis TaxID=586526 RepID=A0A565C3P7_9BRAS|nr:unnamed protein product [Arabis nemorensis]
MDEDSLKKYATRGNGFYDRVAATNVFHEQNLSRCTRVSVEGYECNQRSIGKAFQSMWTYLSCCDYQRS